MADQPPPDGEGAGTTPPESSEGVRLIKADEAAEAVERGEAVRRRPDDRPKYGDRPETPDGPRPDLRFPLADSADPTLIVRPKVAPVEPRVAEAAGQGRPASDQPADELPADESPADASPADAPPADTRPVAEPPTSPIVTTEDLSGSGPSGGDDDRLVSGPTSESVELPHWTAAATGEVPKVIIGDVDDDDEENARWSTFADQGPRWRDQSSGEWDPD